MDFKSGEEDIQHNNNGRYSCYLQNAVGKGSIYVTSEHVPRNYMGYMLWGHILGSGNASPVAVSIISPVNMTVRLFGQDHCAFICAGGRTEQTTLLGLASICLYLSVNLGGNTRFQLDVLQIRNKLHTTKADNEIDLQGLHRHLCQMNLEVSYNPANFPGLSVHFKVPGTRDSMTATVFKTGAINFAGCRDSDLAQRANYYLQNIISPFFGRHVDQRKKASEKSARANLPAKGQRRKPGGNTTPRISAFGLYLGQKAEHIKQCESPAD